MSVTAQTTPSTTSRGQQYMTFRLGEQLYGIDILAVQEIRRYSPPTALPDVPSHVRGVVNLRGAVVPVFDLRLRFGMPDAIGRLTVIIVVVVNEQSVGLVVDEVTAVLRLAEGGLRPTPGLNQRIDTSFIVGLAPKEEGLVTILDVERLVGGELGEMA